MSFFKISINHFKSSHFFNFFYVISLVIGLFSLVLVQSFRNAIEDNINKKSQSFIASDVALSARRILIDEDIKKWLELTKDQALEHSIKIETYSVASSEDHSRTSLVNVFFVDEKFPFYGGVSNDAQVWQTGFGRDLDSEARVIISRETAIKLSIKEGMKLQLGGRLFEVHGIFDKDDFSSFRGFSLAPKIFVAKRYMQDTGLVQLGSTLTHSILFKAKDSKKLETQLKDLIKDKTVKIVTKENSNQALTRSLSLIADYLNLISLLTYVITCIGIFYFIQHISFIRMKEIALYKVFGLNQFQLMLSMLSHIVILTMIAIGIDIAFFEFFKVEINQQVFELTGEKLNLSLYLNDYFLLLGFVFLSIGVFIFPTYISLVRVKEKQLFDESFKNVFKIKFMNIFTYVVLFYALSFILTYSFKVSAVFVLLICFVPILVFVGLKLLESLKLKMSNFYFFIVFKSITRNKKQSLTILTALVIALSFFNLIYGLNQSLKNEFDLAQSGNRPSLFMFDIQEDQINTLKSFVEKINVENFFSAPIIRGKLLKINGVDHSLVKRNQNVQLTREEEFERATQSRMINLTYRDHLLPFEKVISGKFSQRACIDPNQICEISLEEQYAKRMNLNINDEVIFDIAGMQVKTKVTSIRKVKWTSFMPNFFIVVEKGFLVDAPKVFLASLHTKKNLSESISMINDQFKTISIINVSEMTQKISKLLSSLSSAVSAMALLALISTSVMILSVFVSHLQSKIQDFSLLSLLGVSHKSLKSLLLLEFFLLILLGIAVGTSTGEVLLAIILKNVFMIEVFHLSQGYLFFVFTFSFFLMLVLFIYTLVRFTFKSKI